ncbi:unnamed protein product [Soboliphyme baturini]|uniref:Uncharacterized protein n=1 Tax=Soboliphyme baturini TaxID=241478 RepID=A0A183J7J8_9BILA|nr:unnamed protein product [Soboliphyme baturini]
MASPLLHITGEREAALIADPLFRCQNMNELQFQTITETPTLLKHYPSDMECRAMSELSACFIWTFNFRCRFYRIIALFEVE